MTLAPENEKVRAGANSLVKLRTALAKDAGVNDDDAFERGWIDQALLSAYKQLGMQKEVRRLSTSIAAQLVVSMLFSEGKL